MQPKFSAKILNLFYKCLKDYNELTKFVPFC